MKFTSILSRVDDIDIYHWYFSIPNEIAEEMIDGNDRMIVCTVNEKEGYHCAIHGDGTGGLRIMLNQQRCKKLKLTKGEPIQVEVEKDRSEYGMEMSEELREVLDQMPRADELFHKLTKGRQRTLMYWIQNVKSSDINIRRTIVMCTHLEEQDGTPDFKLMNEEMKAANQAANRN